MSKAFTRESDDESGAEETPSFRPQLPPGTRNYITREGADRVKQRLNDLLEKKQAMATMSNEAGTGSATDQRKIESAIRRLQQTLDSVIVAELPVDQEKIAFGATVIVRHGNGEESAYRIVGVEEADPERGSISWISPLARALLSRRARDKVRFRSPAGDEELTIMTVRYSRGAATVSHKPFRRQRHAVPVLIPVFSQNFCRLIKALPVVWMSNVVFIVHLTGTRIAHRLSKSAARI